MPCYTKDRADNSVLKFLAEHPEKLRLPKVKNIELSFGCRKMKAPMPKPEKVVALIMDAEASKNRGKFDGMLNYEKDEFIKFYKEVLEVRQFSKR